MLLNRRHHLLLRFRTEELQFITSRALIIASSFLRFCLLQSQIVYQFIYQYAFETPKQLRRLIEAINHDACKISRTCSFDNFRMPAFDFEYKHVCQRQAFGDMRCLRNTLNLRYFHPTNVLRIV